MGGVLTTAIYCWVYEKRAWKKIPDAFVIAILYGTLLKISRERSRLLVRLGDQR